MKFTKLFIIFSTICILNASLHSTISLKSIVEDLNLAKSICKITNDVAKSTTDTKDILILNSIANNESNTVNEILKCIDD